MNTSPEIESFIRDYVKHLSEGNAAIFAGAGLSRGAGFVDWKELLREIAKDLGLNIDDEYDLISIAQYHVNDRGRDKIKNKILSEFSDEEDLTPNHKILARLPINTYWTTNYDQLLERALKEEHKIVDTKYTIDQLLTTRPRRDAVIYKMHGDVNHPADAVITKEDYQVYHYTHEPFITLLNGDLLSKNFLFLGFSFTDPNLEYVLSRVKLRHGKQARTHYCFIRKHRASDSDCPNEATLAYKLQKQKLFVDDLRRYQIKALLIDDYDDITEILREIETRFKKRTVFISGSAADYGRMDQQQAQGFIHNLSKALIKAGYRIVNGFGWGVGSAVINGALEAIYERPDKYTDDQLIMRPFPQFKTGAKELPELWTEYRQRMIAEAGVAVYVFGNKLQDGQLIDAPGVHEEFEIAKAQGVTAVPIGSTGFMTEQIYREVVSEYSAALFQQHSDLAAMYSEIGDSDRSDAKTIQSVINIITKLQD
ncbi:SIR2 family protein [Spirosoma sp. SC4-14]|uniref:SIR2 family protein n=1 Tax=Spirosoma sp. SC4-14 TaxID=3128900 RepID=UPI0030CE992C